MSSSGPAPKEGTSAAPARPVLAAGATRCMQLEREVEQEYQPQLLGALQQKVDAVAESIQGQAPQCARCGQPMQYHDTRRVSWWARFGKLVAWAERYRCSNCQGERRPLLEELSVEPRTHQWIVGSFVGTLWRAWRA